MERTGRHCDDKFCWCKRDGEGFEWQGDGCGRNRGVVCVVYV